MAAVDSTPLQHYLECVETYMQGCGLLRIPRTPGPLRTQLAATLRAHLPVAVGAWVRAVADAFQIPASQWAEIAEWMHDAMHRWCRHIEDPRDIATYTYLFDHARRGFISQFPASRFLSGQMRMYEQLVDHVRAVFAAEPAQRDALLALLHQEFQERILHITDFFVAGREDQLREQEASYRQASEHAPAAIFHVDHEHGRILEASVVAARTLGYRRDELASLTIWDLIPDEDRARAERLFEATGRHGSSTREDLHLRRRDGSLVPVFFNAGLIEYGHHQSFQVICVDVSDRKRLERQLLQSEKMAAIGQLAAGIAHEIRNPLGIVTTALYDLDDLVASDDPDVREDLRIAQEEMGRVQAIINSLLEFSRESRAEFELVDVNDLLRKTLQLMHKSLQHSGVQVETDLGPLGLCVANQNALRQVLLNLITNAVHAMPRGGALHLRTALVPDGRLQLEVRDTGVGIPAEHLRDIFNPFFTTKPPGQGTGLGLSMVHSVVRRYRGEIRVESEVGRGTTFTIELPCQGPEPPDAPAT